jgi:hypothetical protein
MKAHSRDHTVASRTHPRTIFCAIACALLGSALTSVAPASANERTEAARALVQERYYSSYSEPETSDAGTAAAKAQERYYSSYGEPETSGDAGTTAAKAQERYYSSYGQPEPMTVAQAAEPSDETQWLPIALSITVALAIVAASATLARRLRIRRRARVTT